MEVYDYRKIYKNLYRGNPQLIEIVEVPSLHYVVTKGKGQRNVYSIHEGEGLWSLSRVVNRLKDMSKNNSQKKFNLMPLVIIWSKVETEASDWTWTAYMQLPEFITSDMFTQALLELERRNRNVKVPVRLEIYDQQLAVQATHLGPYNQINETYK
ncbi:hypothetical protein [Bacillus pinisoli]|uniref:hypothetical protein n=1 Tax=Bacillus pinisoli TaxID=2901866 RepID=UPI001FF5B0C8|nr:hypothetical protein [Bacillus pinisoli]